MYTLLSSPNKQNVFTSEHLKYTNAEAVFKKISVDYGGE